MNQFNLVRLTPLQTIIQNVTTGVAYTSHQTETLYVIHSSNSA